MSGINIVVGVLLSMFQELPKQFLKTLQPLGPQMLHSSTKLHI